MPKTKDGGWILDDTELKVDWKKEIQKKEIEDKKAKEGNAIR